MKKSNFITLMFFCIVIIAVILFSCFYNKNSSTKVESSANHSNKSSSVFVSSQPVSSNKISSCFSSSSNFVATQTEKPNSSQSYSSKSSSLYATDKKPQTLLLEKSLFIGDSRTVGIMEYAGITGADYFCTSGMSVFNVFKNRISVPSVGKVTLNELMLNKKYDKIYIMLGINEIGYNFKSIIKKYDELIDFIEKNQPDSLIFVQANLHISKNKSESDKIINNTAINNLNKELSNLSKSKNHFFIDANFLFDDSQGNLSAEKTQDSVHLYAKYYAQWGKWICEETERIVKES